MKEQVVKQFYIGEPSPARLSNPFCRAEKEPNQPTYAKAVDPRIPPILTRQLGLGPLRSSHGFEVVPPQPHSHRSPRRR